MTVWGPAEYGLVRLLLQRGLALIYLLAFLVAARQFRPLAGEDGLLPLSRYVEVVEFRERPSLFHLVPDDRAVGLAAWTGVALAALALSGLPGRFGWTATMVVWALTWALYLSFVNAGQLFYGYGWESMLLEAGFLAVFLGGGGVAPPEIVVWLFRWLLFRNMFGAGLIKLRGDDCWTELTCLDYHYETQPMPNPLSWYAHHAPDWLHRAGVVTNHVVELAVPFLYFAPQPVAALAGLATILFQGWLMLTGNFSWLNALTAVLAFSTFSDGTLLAAVPDGLVDALPVVGAGAVTAPALAPTPLPLQAAAAVLLLVVAVLSVYPVANVISPRQAMNRSFDPLKLVNTYGAFGSITRERYEIVVQGTDDEPTAGADWREYEFPGKPTDPARRPPQWAPYHLRLDWQLWFAAMSSARRNPWFVHLLGKLLAGDEATLGLLRSNPFPDDPPEHVRALLYRYRFTTPEERAETGRWWHRERVDTYYGPVSLSDPRFRSTLRRLGWSDDEEPPG